jgi:hypothetical protein
MCYIDGQKNKYSVLNECNRMLKYNIFMDKGCSLRQLQDLQLFCIDIQIGAVFYSVLHSGSNNAYIECKVDHYPLLPPKPRIPDTITSHLHTPLWHGNSLLWKGLIDARRVKGVKGKHGLGIESRDIEMWRSCLQFMSKAQACERVIWIEGTKR